MSKKPESYEELKNIWYKKLKDSGFKDIEDPKCPDGNTQAFSYRRLKKEDEIRISTRLEAKKEYYYLGYQFLHSHKFESELHRIIWNYHVEGIGVRNTAKLLRDAKVADYDRNAVWAIVNHYRKIMKKKLKIK